MYRLSKTVENMFSSSRGSEIYARIITTVEEEGMSAFLENGVLLGLSGGADSVFLLCFLKEYARRAQRSAPLLAVHVNHGIRGDEADRDEEFSRRFADSLSVGFTSVTVDVPALAEEMGIGIEEAARNARYSIFADLISSRNELSTIAVAHNSTDNVETVLMNILRGSGLSGVCGIKPVRDNIIRPLIRISKSEILSLLDEYGIAYVTDSSNKSCDYTRNYVRNEILPLLGNISANPDSAITRLTKNLRCDLDYIDTQANLFIAEHCRNKMRCTDLKGLHSAVLAKVLSKIIFEATGEYPEEKHIHTLRDLLKTDNFRYSLPGSFDFVCQRGVCFFSEKLSENKLSGQIFPLVMGENKICGTNLTVFIGEFDKTLLNVYNFSIQAFISSDIIDSGLFLRFKADGDSYRYHGMTHKLKKVFNDRNIPSVERDLIPVVCDEQGIVVVPGMSERDDAKSTDRNKNIPIIFAYKNADEDEIEASTALLRK